MGLYKCNLEIASHQLPDAVSYETHQILPIVGALKEVVYVALTSRLTLPMLQAKLRALNPSQLFYLAYFSTNPLT